MPNLRALVSDHQCKANKVLQWLCTGRSQKKRKEKIAAATYLYQADCDGEWGEIQFNFEEKTAQIIQLADWDLMISQPFAKHAISYLLNCQREKLPKETVISFDA